MENSLLWPDESLQLFDVPVETITTVANGAVGQLVKADPYRVVLVMIINGGAVNNVPVTTSPSPQNGSQGLLIGATVGQQLTFTHRLHGPLTQQAWFANNLSGAMPVNVLTIELRLVRRPEQYRNPEVYYDLGQSILGERGHDRQSALAAKRAAAWPDYLGWTDQ